MHTVLRGITIAIDTATKKRKRNLAAISSWYRLDVLLRAGERKSAGINILRFHIKSVEPALSCSTGNHSHWRCTCTLPLFTPHSVPSLRPHSPCIVAMHEMDHQITSSRPLFHGLLSRHSPRVDQRSRPCIEIAPLS